MNNYPADFKGVEGEEEQTYLFYIHGEPAIEHYTEKEAKEELLDMSIRELVSKGFITIE